MNKVDDFGLFICKYISDLFEYSSKMGDCSSKVFIKAYIYSEFRKRTEDKSFVLNSIDIPFAYNEIKTEKSIHRGKEIYPSYVMAWIGYIMKYFSIVTGVNEIELYKKMKPEEFYQLYESYHSLDNDLVVKRIIESKKINIDVNNLDIFKMIHNANLL